MDSRHSRYSGYETPSSQVTRKTSCNRKNQSSGMQGIFGGDSTTQDSYQRNNRISTTTGSNIVHSPYTAGGGPVSPPQDSSPYSNPLDVLENFKKNALEELMQKHNSDINQKSEQNTDNSYSRPYVSSHESQPIRDQQQPSNGPVAPIEEFSSPPEIQEPATEVEETKQSSAMRTTKPPVGKKKPQSKNGKVEDLNLTKENYHYAKQKLKKDHERLRKSSQKQRRTGEGFGRKPPSKVVKPKQDEHQVKHPFLRRKEPAYRPPSVGMRRTTQKKPDQHEEKNNLLHKKQSMEFTHSNTKTTNQDLTEVMSHAGGEFYQDEIPKRKTPKKMKKSMKKSVTSKIKEDESYVTMGELERIKQRIKDPVPDLEFESLPEQNFEEEKVMETAPQHKVESIKIPERVEPDHGFDNSKSPPPDSIEDLETPKPRESPVKISKPSLKRPKNNPRKAPVQEQIVVYKNCDINNIISTLRQETGGKNKKSEIDERRFISLKSQINSLISKNNALLDINKKQKRCLMESLHCMNDTEAFLKTSEEDQEALRNLLQAKLPEDPDISQLKFSQNGQKISKSVKACKKRLENIMKEERRNYTLANFGNNPLYEAGEFGMNHDTYEEEEKDLELKIDRSMLWNLEQKLSNILKRSVEIYKDNILSKQPFEKIRVLKYSECLRDTINDIITLGVGIRDKDCDLTSASSFEQWDDYVESNISLKIDPTHLGREEKTEYLTDSLIETLWDIAKCPNSRKEKKEEFHERVSQIRRIERADKTKTKICENQIRLLRACFSEIYDEIETLKRKAKNDMNKLITKVENNLHENFCDLENTLEKCKINESNDVEACYIELYTIFKHLQPEIRDGFDFILENKDEDYQNIFGIKSKIKQLLTQDYFT